MTRRSPTTAVLLAAAVAGCNPVAQVTQQWFDDRTPRERYEARLAQAGLEASALGRDWTTAAERALTDAPTVAVPWDEQGFLSPAEPAAFAYRVRVERGQELTFGVRLQGDSTALVFLEAWHVADSAGTLRRVAVADSGARQLTFEPRRAGEYLLRAQPELLRGGRFVIQVRLGPTLSFPVANGRDTDIGSEFGAARDGGARRHQGIDIFARRGTPVLATGDAYVSRVGENRLGGLVVWLRDERGNRLYYAHLSSWAVAEGQRVRAGDTVGFVGNTGNARTTPPHLHFGIYRRGEGPLDPRWFVQRVPGRVPRLAADTSLLGAWARTPGPVQILAAPDPRAAARDTVPRHTAVQVLAAGGSWYRVRLPDGLTGYLPAGRVQPVSGGVEVVRLDRDQLVANRPAGSDPAYVLAGLSAGTEVTVLARHGGRLLVRMADGRSGWVASGAAPSGVVTD